MRGADPAREGGHGARARRGRSALRVAVAPEERAPVGREDAALEASMWRLLELGGVRPASRRVAVGGLDLHYLEVGEGEPLALIQGAGGGAANWFRIMGALSRGRRVLALDLPGFGLSAPVWPVAPLGRLIAEIVVAWLDAIGVRRCDVVGTSFGGLVALRMAQRRGGPVRRLVLLDSAGLGRELPLVVRLASVPGVGPWLLRPGRAGTRWVFRNLMTTERSGIGPVVEEALVEYLWRSDLAANRGVVAEAYRLFCDLRGQREVLSDAELASLEVSTLVAWGENDRFLPPQHGRRAAERIPGAIFREIRGVGHSPNWEAPDAVVEVVESFLAGATPDLS